MFTVPNCKIPKIANSSEQDFLILIENSWQKNPVWVRDC